MRPKELWSPERIVSSCSICGTCRFTPVTIPVTIHEWGKNRIPVVPTTNGSYMWKQNLIVTTTNGTNCGNLCICISGDRYYQQMLITFISSMQDSMYNDRSIWAYVWHNSRAVICESPSVHACLAESSAHPFFHSGSYIKLFYFKICDEGTMEMNNKQQNICKM